MDWFAPAAGLQAAAGRAAAEHQRNAEKHLREALRLQPGVVEIAFALIQVCCGFSARGRTSILCREKPVAQAWLHWVCHGCSHSTAMLQPPPGGTACHRLMLMTPDSWKPRFAVHFDRIPPLTCLQMYFATGRPEQALSAAMSVAESNPEDVNAHALKLLCTEALGKIDEVPAEALMTCTDMLQCDGTSRRCVGSAPGQMAMLFLRSASTAGSSSACIHHPQAWLPDPDVSHLLL